MSENMTTANQFLDSIEQFGLLSQTELATIRQEMLSTGGANAQATAAKLVERQALTSFQAERLLAGRGADCVLSKRYRILGQLGSGAMGTVYRARDTTLDRDVAIKVLPAELVNDPEAVARFQREAKALAKLSHPAIIQAHDSDEDRGQHFLVMEYVEGSTLQRIVNDLGRVPPLLAADYAFQTASGLAHAHQKGLVHRDLKPSNLLVTREGRVKILDLGLARFLQDQIGDPNLTCEGMGMGTPDYMAPEQFVDAHKADARSDIYGLGCTLYHLLAGQVPFPGSSLVEKRLAQQQREPAAVEGLRPDIPLGLAMIVRRMMAKQPADRFQTAAELGDALSLYVAGSSRSLPPVAATASWRSGTSGIAIGVRHSPLRKRVRLGAAIGAAVCLILVAAMAPRYWPSKSISPLVSGHAAGPKKNARPPRRVLDEPNVLSVAQDGTGRFRSINAALEQAKPGMTIRILDDATYREHVAIARPSAHARITLDSPRRATIENAATSVLVINDVPHVRISGLRLRTKGTAGMAILGRVQGVVLNNLELEGNGSFAALTAQPNGQSLFGIAAEGVDISDDQRPLVIENCTVRHFVSGIRVSAIQNDYHTPQAGRRVIIRNNRIEDCASGIVLVGQVQKVHVVGNRIWGVAMMALQLETLLDGAQDVLLANNTIFDSKWAFRLWDESVRGKNIRIFNNLIVGRPENPDMLFIDSGGSRETPRGAGDGNSVHGTWQWSHNWREVRKPEGNDLMAKSWIPPAATDVVREEIPLMTRDPESPDFLRPVADSELASGGVGSGDSTLPKYVGAIPPHGVAAWDWQKVWDDGE